MRVAVLLAALIISLHAAETFYEIPKILWTFWDTGFDSARLFTRMCINNMGYYSNISGWEFRFLSNQNYTQYISKESLIRLDRMYTQSKHALGRQNWADLMRLFLIYENGGMWVDTNSFFLGNFSWIENIAKEKWLQNKLTPQPQMITFSLSSVMGGNATKVYDEKLGSQVFLFPGVEIWSFISKPKSKFLTDVINRLEYALAIEQSVLDEQTTKLGIQFGREKDPYYITSNYVFQTVLQKKQREIDASHNQTSKYAVQHYQLWDIPSENTIFGVFSAQSWFTFNVISTLINEPLSVHQQRYDIPAYFIKFNGGNYPHINNALVYHQFVGCLGIDVSFKEGSLFEEFMLRPNRHLPQIKHIRELYQSGYMRGDCEHLGSYVAQAYSKLERYLWMGVAVFVGWSGVVVWAVRRRVGEESGK